MQAGTRWIVERLAELRARLAGIRMPSESLPSVPAGGAEDRALAALEAGAMAAVEALDRRAGDAERSLRRAPTTVAELTSANLRLTRMQLDADALFRTLDLFNDALATRSDASNALLLRGADRLVAAALERSVPGYSPPAAVTYFDSTGRGGAIARARTRLPGGIVLPIALVRVSPETLPTRLTSLLHEAGHQLNSDLNLLDEGASTIARAARLAGLDAEECATWASFTSELLADVWGHLLGGVPSIDGLQRVLSLPGALLFHLRAGDPHPPGMLRVAFALAFLKRLHRDPSLARLEQRFNDVYAPTPVPESVRRRFSRLERAVPALVDAFHRTPFSGLGNRTLVAVCAGGLPSPDELRAHRHCCSVSADALAAEPPLHALARLGQARVDGALSPHDYDRVARRWLTALARRHYFEAHGLRLARRPNTCSRTAR